MKKLLFFVFLLIATQSKAVKLPIKYVLDIERVNNGYVVFGLPTDKDERFNDKRVTVYFLNKNLEIKYQKSITLENSGLMRSLCDNNVIENGKCFIVQFPMYNKTTRYIVLQKQKESVTELKSGAMEDVTFYPIIKDNQNDSSGFLAIKKANGEILYTCYNNSFQKKWEKEIPYSKYKDLPYYYVAYNRLYHLSVPYGGKKNTTGELENEIGVSIMDIKSGQLIKFKTVLIPYLISYMSFEINKKGFYMIRNVGKVQASGISNLLMGKNTIETNCIKIYQVDADFNTTPVLDYSVKKENDGESKKEKYYLYSHDVIDNYQLLVMLNKDEETNLENGLYSWKYYYSLLDIDDNEINFKNKPIEFSWKKRDSKILIEEDVYKKNRWDVWYDKKLIELVFYENSFPRLEYGDFKPDYSGTDIKTKDKNIYPDPMMCGFANGRIIYHYSNHNKAQKNYILTTNWDDFDKMPTLSSYEMTDKGITLLKNIDWQLPSRFSKDNRLTKADLIEGTDGNVLLFECYEDGSSEFHFESLEP